ncbi:Uncharacterized protein TCM_022137 [Theobroma cacao]|uniref:Uncharacterized protein n=1 Tax=Theobroma cacao TaxID=3641 RepID=A0A061EZY2_THECC|nr:Uncharacterized protein TCM_022137 [Theobroma cacao]
MTIWYDILFAVNSVSKSLQSKDMCIDIAIEQLKSLSHLLFLPLTSIFLQKIHKNFVPQIRDALLKLVEVSEDPKTKSEANCLATYELEN